MRRLVLLIYAAGVVLAGPAIAIEAFVGHWAMKPEACKGSGNTPATAPLIANDKSVGWFGGSCRIHKMYKLGQVIYVQALCVDGKNIPITLDARGDRMRVTWDRGKPEELRRCK